LLGVAALGAAHHHAYRDVAARDDIRQLADEEPRPVQLRGVILQEPTLRTPAIERPVEPGLVPAAGREHGPVGRGLGA
ncbi:MAG: hypothetical protein NZ700_11690, partial [Gemmataceae bacterium]|nr:hypothetical protein [Gemmataceae bacterium]MDW8265621.1 hypothetical protein [Gemmataceae bacterium]